MRKSGWFLRFCLLFLIFGPLLSSAQTIQQDSMRRYQSDKILFPKPDSKYAQVHPGRYPPFLDWLFTKVFVWTPEGSERIEDDNCSSGEWQKHFYQSKNLEEQAGAIRSYFKNCEEELETGVNALWRNGLGMMTMKYAPQKHPFLHRVVFKLPGNIELKGLLALKGDRQKRPLVVVRLGVFSNTEEFYPERYLMMQLFEQSPFNVLLIENMTGADFIFDNDRKLAFGGYDEGLQNILVAQILTDPKEPLSQVISSLHLMGVSLGGNGVLFASLLNEINSGVQGQKLYQSFLTMCPVVNLKESMRQLTVGRFKSLITNVWASRRLEGLKAGYPMFSYLDEAIQNVTEKYEGGLSYTPQVKLPQGVSDSKDFWKNNHFWPQFKNVKSPILVMTTKEDDFVPYQYNSALLATKEFKNLNNNMQVVQFERGQHCSLPVSYDWKAVSTILQSYFLSYTPNFKMREQSMDMDVSDNWPKGFVKEKPRVRFTMEWPDKGRYVQLDVTAKSKDNEETLKLSLPLTEFDFYFMNTQISEAEREMMVRWLNQNLQLSVIEKDNKEYLRVTWKKL